MNQATFFYDKIRILEGSCDTQTGWKKRESPIQFGSPKTSKFGVWELQGGLNGGTWGPHKWLKINAATYNW